LGISVQIAFGDALLRCKSANLIRPLRGHLPQRGRYFRFGASLNSNLSSDLQKTIRTDLICSTDRLYLYSSFLTAFFQQLLTLALLSVAISPVYFPEKLKPDF
jgi:hypothetical protein